MRPGGNVDCIYGETGTYKTTNIGFFAEWIYARTGRPLRLVSGDLGGYRPIQDYIDAGIIQAVSLLGFDHPSAVMECVVKGWWWTDPKNPNRLVAPKPGEVEASCGGYAFEGMTSWCDLMMDSLKETGPKLGQDPAYRHSEVDAVSGAQLNTHGGNQTYYGYVQGRIYTLLRQSNGLPVLRVLWTAHEAEFSEAGVKKCGPGVAGRAASPKIPTWVGACIHFSPLVRDTEKQVEGARLATIKQQTVEVRAYFESHRDPLNGMVYSAKPRVPAQQLAEIRAKYPDGWFPLKPEEGLNRFLELEETLLAQGTSKRTDWRKQVDAERAKSLAQRSQEGELEGPS
jgi:hypothetical protein